MSKVIFDAGTGTVLGMTENVLLVDVDDLNEYMQGDEDVSSWGLVLGFDGENGESLLSDEDHLAQRAAIAVGRRLDDILAATDGVDIIPSGR